MCVSSRLGSTEECLATPPAEHLGNVGGEVFRKVDNYSFHMATDSPAARKSLDRLLMPDLVLGPRPGGSGQGAL